MNHVRFHGAMHPHRALRQADSPYRRKTRSRRGAWLDALCWAIVIIGLSGGVVFAVVHTAARLRGMWL